MRIWLIIMGAVFAALILGTVYLTAMVGRFGGIRALTGKHKWYRRGLSLLIIGSSFFALEKLFNMVNAIIIYLHVFAFFLLAGILMWILQKASGKEFRIYWQGWIALGGAILYLGAGYYLCNHVWKTEYRVETAKADAKVKIAMFSDSHLGTTFDGEGLAEYVKEIEGENPDILLIPGDFVDDWSTRKDLEIACKALGEFDAKYGVWLALGNHDEGRFNDRDFSAEELRETVKAHGIRLLEDAYALVDGRFYVAGRRDSSMGPRKTMEELLEGVDPDKYVIVMDHEPNDYSNEAGKADLVLSGHTHGGQFFPFSYVAEMMGAYDRAYGREMREGTEFLVSSGISNWTLQFKTGTRSEYVIIDVE